MMARAPSTAWERVGKIGLVVFIAAIVVFMIAPIVIVVMESFNTARYLSFPPSGYSWYWYEFILGSSAWVSSIVVSLKIGVIAAVIATVVGTMAAWGLSRSRLRAKGVLFGFMFSPAIIPLIVLALAYYFAFADYDIIGNQVMIGIAFSVLGVPYVLIIVRTALNQFDTSQEHAARTLGAGPVRTLFRVTFPQVASSIGGGAIISFIFAFDEAVIILFIGGTGAITLPRKLWDGVRFDLDPRLAAAGTLMIAISIAAFGLGGAVRWLAGYRKRAAMRAVRGTQEKGIAA